MKTCALITGATAGIGQSTALLMAKNGYDLIITGRRSQKLEELSNQIQENYSVSCLALSFDISDREQCESVFKEHEKSLSQISILINNAGLARGVAPMDEAPLDDWDEMIDTNIKGLLYITRLSLPHLKNNQPSHIINIGSVAGRWVYPGGGVYCATKHSVRAITEGLRMDLNGEDIRVTNISPGLVETEFSQVRLRDNEKAKQVYQGLSPLTGDDIADCILWSLQRPKHVNIQEMVVYPTAQASVNLVARN